MIGWQDAKWPTRKSAGPPGDYKEVEVRKTINRNG